MPCFHPLKAYRSRLADGNGKRSISFSSDKNGAADPVKLPCGNCVGCRLERSRQWAVRCMHEAQMHRKNCFITLTFDNEHLLKRKNPDSLDKREFQLFMKRLRFKYGKGIRYYHCGEYGDKYKRPHYHALLFGHDFEDKRLHQVTDAGSRLYTSKELEELWPYGFSTIGDVTFESAAYVARYIMKKINGQLADYVYTVWDDDTGEILSERIPEYTTMSLKPGIGASWYEKYGSDVYPHDAVVINGVVCKPPKYYDRKFQLDRPYEFEEIQNKRLTRAEDFVTDNTHERLLVKEEIAHAKLKKLVRKDI